ncbi:MAG TPA: AraC family transcriptional regulator [Burkholderiaceae bacterium]|nr:AraC family transcriptional regulator [Burkholderiaceae bacterium]
MRVAIIVFDGFDEIDTFVALGLLARLGPLGWRTQLAAPVARATSRNGVSVEVQQPLAFANRADAVLFGGNLYARAIAEGIGQRGAPLAALALDPLRQTIGAQGSGTLLLARLGLLGDMPACTDTATRPWVVEAGVRVLEDEPFHARGALATACGGMTTAACLAAWIMLRLAGPGAAASALRDAAPAGDADAWVRRVLGAVRPFVEASR